MSKDYKLVGTLNMFGSAPVDIYPVFVDDLNVYHLGTTEYCGEATDTITQFVPVLAKYWDKVRKFDQTEKSFEGIKPSYDVGDEAVYAIEYEKGKVYMAGFNDYLNRLKTIKTDNKDLENTINREVEHLNEIVSRKKVREEKEYRALHLIIGQKK